MESQVQKILTKNQLKKTDTRERVLKAFLSSTQALSNQDLESNFDYVDRVTLYRTIKTFEEKGIIHQAIDGTDINKYALCSENCSPANHHDYHAHFTCTQCKATICLEEVTLPELKIPQGFNLVNTNIILNGLCKTCSSSLA